MCLLAHKIQIRPVAEKETKLRASLLTIKTLLVSEMCEGTQAAQAHQVYS